MLFRSVVCVGPVLGSAVPESLRAAVAASPLTHCPTLGHSGMAVSRAGGLESDQADSRHAGLRQHSGLRQES